MSISFSGSTLTFSDSTTMTTAAVAGPPGPSGPPGPAGPSGSNATATGSGGLTGTGTISMNTNNFGGIGSYVLAANFTTSSGCNNATYAGACLSVSTGSTNFIAPGTPSISGTWRFYGPTFSGATSRGGLYIRVS